MLRDRDGRACLLCGHRPEREDGDDDTRRAHRDVLLRRVRVRVKVKR